LTEQYGWINIQGGDSRRYQRTNGAILRDDGFAYASSAIPVLPEYVQMIYRGYDDGDSDREVSMYVPVRRILDDEDLYATESD
jgi:hypothetical protein